MDPLLRNRLINVLVAERRAAEENDALNSAARWPLNAMIGRSDWSCTALEDGTEVFTGHDAVVSVPPHDPSLSAMLLDGGWSCYTLDDGTEVYSDGESFVTVPPSCVAWHAGRERLPPTGPIEMDPKREALLRKLLRQQQADGDTRTYPDDATLLADMISTLGGGGP